MADVATTLAQWSTTAGSNSPADATTVGSGLGDNLRTMQAVTRAYLSHYNSSAIASASTTDLGANTGLIQEISGTTTITGLGTVSAGIWKIVRFQGALTLTYNATSLILPSAANITTAAGDFMLAYSKGSGNWVVPFFQRANGQSLNIGFKGSAVASATTTDIWAAEGDYVHITGTTTITGLGTAPVAGAQKVVVFDGALTLTHNATSLILPGGANITTAANDRMIVRADTTANMMVISYVKANGKSVINTANTQPTSQVFTTGSGTYTTPANCTSIRVRLVGGGSGGAGSGTSGGASSAGGNTTFSTLTAGGGSSSTQVSPGAGGTASGGDINIPGGRGGGFQAGSNAVGGVGGASAFGGSGHGGSGQAGTTAGGSASANSGAGGGGAGCLANGSACGGSPGGYVEKRINSPDASYSYAVGAGGGGGTLGTGGDNGGAGATGIVIVEEFYD